MRGLQGLQQQLRQNLRGSQLVMQQRGAAMGTILAKSPKRAIRSLLLPSPLWNAGPKNTWDPFPPGHE